MSKIFKIRMNCVGFKDYAVSAKSKKEARELVEKSHHQCDGTEFEFGEFLEFDKFEQIDMHLALEDTVEKVAEL